MRAIAKEGQERIDQVRRLGASSASAEAPTLVKGYNDGYVKPKPQGLSSGSEPEVAHSHERVSKHRKTAKGSTEDREDSKRSSNKIATDSSGSDQKRRRHIDKTEIKRYDPNLRPRKGYQVLHLYLLK